MDRSELGNQILPKSGLERNTSVSSQSSTSTRSSSNDPFAYQTRLLERTSSVRSGSSLARAGSLSNGSNPLIPTATGPRSFRPRHNVSGSIESIRDKWQDRANEALLESQRSASPTRGIDGTSGDANLHSPIRASDVSSRDDTARTPRQFKRNTMPAHIHATPLSPNTTGVSITGPDHSSSPFSTPTSTRRIHLPSSFVTPTRSSRYIPELPNTPSQSNDTTLTPSRSKTMESALTEPDNPKSNVFGLTPRRPLSQYAPRNDNYVVSPPSPSKAAARPPSRALSTASSGWSESTSPERTTFRSPSRSSVYTEPSSPEKQPSRPPSQASMSEFGFAESSVNKRLPEPPVEDSDAPSSVMAPKVYRSSIGRSRKAEYNKLSIGRRLGRHMPRIASGDGDENWEEETQDDIDRRKRREARAKQGTPNRSLGNIFDSSTLRGLPSPTKSLASHAQADDVAGIRGRIRLSKDVATPVSSAAKASTSRGALWHDVKRQHIQAYEYLCHVGEAQQWIEGQLGEELGFGVVEMDEGLRNGVVLARLAQSIPGAPPLRRLYEAPKLDYRHTDNINYFVEFVRNGLGLPEYFMFELTDLYNKKNIPKVIYCIHALSHLLVRRGLAARIGNLIGHLEFSDEQLMYTQRGLKDSGAPMPNFGNVGKTLAQEMNEDPEEEIETEEERQLRELKEHEVSIVSLQSQSRAFLVRKAKARERLAMEHRARFLQAQCRGALVRIWISKEKRQQQQLQPWAIATQAAIRGRLTRQRYQAHRQLLTSTSRSVVQIQAQCRGVLERRRRALLKQALSRAKISVVALQARGRGKLQRAVREQATKTFSDVRTIRSVVGLQAELRTALVQRQLVKFDKSVSPYVRSYMRLQAQVRGVLTRRRYHTQLARLDDVSDVVVRIQSATRTYMERKRLLNLIRGLRQATPAVVTFQALARAKLRRQEHVDMNKNLTQVKVISSVGILQARARAALVRRRQLEQEKKLAFVTPDISGMQAQARMFLVRSDYIAWRDHLWRNVPVVVFMQALFRGVIQRRDYQAKLKYFSDNLNKVVKIQALFRAKECREQYRQLTMGENVTADTIKNFIHLLDDSDVDFQDEIKVERLRKEVVAAIRENQHLETVVSDLDSKIALVVQNVKSFEEVDKYRRSHGDFATVGHGNRTSILAAYSDPFSGSSALDHDTKRRLELYKQLFFLLQTQPQYLARFLLILARDDVQEKDRRFSERAILTLFGFGQDRREDYLLLKLFQLSIRDEVRITPSIPALTVAHPLYLSVALRYCRPKQVTYVRDTFQKIIQELVEAEDLDLETDPVKLYRQVLDLAEIRAGQPSVFPKDVSAAQAMNHPEAHALVIHHLQALQWWTETFVLAILESLRRLPYNIRFLAKETLSQLRANFPNALEEHYSTCLGRLVFHRYINPAIMTPESFELVDSTIDIGTRRNLAQISKVLGQIVSGKLFGQDNSAYMPINNYVVDAIKQMGDWLLEVADVPDSETHFHADEFLDATVEPKPIFISPNEVYAIHALMTRHQADIAPQPNDTLRIILNELGGVPTFGSEELKEARDQAITLELTNRFANVRDPRADEKALWVQAKRGVLAVLRVQPAHDLLEALIQPVTDADEDKWDAILEAEALNQRPRGNERRMPSTAVGEAYRLEDIRSMSFQQVKAGALGFLLELEKLSLITRKDSFQGILDAIASDVRSKHRKRLQRQQEMQSMREALKNLRERRKYFEEQIESYNNYAEGAMQTMQKGKGKKRSIVLPFTKQYYHLRDLQKSGKKPQFGSFRYTAKSWYDKKILLSLEQYSPRQFDKIDFVISSNQPGVFAIEVYNNTLGITNRIAAQDLRMEELLHAQFENQSSLNLFNGIAKVNLGLFLYQINKKFYV